MRRGLTIVELVLVCTFVGLVAGIAVPRAGDMLDSVRLQQASHEVAGALTLARVAAIRRPGYSRLILDESSGEVRVEIDADTIHRRDLKGMHRVSLTASRDTIIYAPSGMGFGIANSTIVVSIGARAETLVVSRLGRVRRSF